MAKRSASNFKKRKANQKSIREVFLISEGRHTVTKVEGLPGVVNVGTEGHLDREPKGQRGGRCNITACQRPGAVFQNVGMINTGGSWYCLSCATDINNVNQRDVERGCGFTLFPAFDQVKERYKALRRSGEDTRDIGNYSDIEQNPWGSCNHFDRDKYENTNRFT